MTTFWYINVLILPKNTRKFNALITLSLHLKKDFQILKNWHPVLKFKRENLHETDGHLIQVIDS